MLLFHWCLPSGPSLWDCGFGRWLACETAARGHVPGGRLLPGLPGTPWCPPVCLQILYCFSRLASSRCSVLRPGGRRFGERARAAESRQEEGTGVPCALSPVPLLRRAWGSNISTLAGNRRKRAELLCTTEEVQWAKGSPRGRAGDLRTELHLRRLLIGCASPKCLILLDVSSKEETLQDGQFWRHTLTERACVFTLTVSGKGVL